MLTKPTIQQVTAMHVTVHQPYWKDVGQLIELELEATLDAILNTADTAAVHVLRGRAQVLKELLALSKGTRALLDRMDPK